MNVLFEDNHLIAVRKPAGMPSQGDATGDVSIFDEVKAYLKDQHQKPGEVYLGLLHRLDRPVGGVMLLAKTSKAANRMTEQFKNHSVRKTYWAVSERIPEPVSSMLQHYLKKMPGKNIMRAYYHEVPDSKIAILDYRTLEARDSRALVEIKPLTGRQHQIRVQMSKIGCPIVGDMKYDPQGMTKFLPDNNIALFARRLTFTHPVTRKEESLELLPPDEFPWNLFPQHTTGK